MSQMNELRLQYEGFDSQLGHYFSAYIDEFPLLDRVCEFEQGFAGSISGAYMPGINEAFIERALSVDEAALTPLVCNCGDIDCWQLTVEQSTYAGLVVWHDWANPNRSGKRGWCYDDFSVMSFNVDDYRRTLEDALLFLQRI